MWDVQTTPPSTKVFASKYFHLPMFLFFLSYLVPRSDKTKNRIKTPEIVTPFYLRRPSFISSRKGVPIDTHLYETIGLYCVLSLRKSVETHLGGRHLFRIDLGSPVGLFCYDEIVVSSRGPTCRPCPRRPTPHPSLPSSLFSLVSSSLLVPTTTTPLAPPSKQVRI